MRLFTRQEMDLLARYEETFNTAYNFNFKRGTTGKDNDIVADIYEAAGGTGISRNWSCGHCALDLYRKAGKHYFETRKYLDVQVALKGKNKKDKKTDK